MFLCCTQVRAAGVAKRAARDRQRSIDSGNSSAVLEIRNVEVDVAIIIRWQLQLARIAERTQAARETDIRGNGDGPNHDIVADPLNGQSNRDGRDRVVRVPV